MGLPTLLLTRTTTLTVPAATWTAIPWSTSVNTGPSSWWSSGSPTNIVMPWTGRYIYTLSCTWVGTAVYWRRIQHLHRGSSFSDQNFEYPFSYTSDTGTQEGRYGQTDILIEVPTAGESWQVYVDNRPTSGSTSRSLTAGPGTIPPATASFTYLDGG